MLIGYVSDERYVALADVALEFIDARGESWETRSRATGAVYLDLHPGSYTVTLQRAGYGAKRSLVTSPTSFPHHFRLLGDGLSGYVWPKWVRSGAPLALWRTTRALTVTCRARSEINRLAATLAAPPRPNAVLRELRPDRR